MILSALGWIAAVVTVALLLFVGKPYYQNLGYEEGRRVQSEANVKMADAAIAARVIEGTDYVVFGRIAEVNSAGLVIETRTPYLNNPLREEPRRQTILVDSTTVIEKRTILPTEQFIAAQEEARLRGLSTQDAVVHTSETLALSDLRIGDEIRVYPRVAQDAVKDQFEAKQILFVISNQQAPSN